jgi:hypothetical protein
MNLYDLILLMMIAMFAVQFWRFRGIAESAQKYLQDYCDKKELQLLSVARNKTRLGVYRGKLDWQSEFIFEFSGNGEDSYQGQIKMSGLRVLETWLPAYKIN